MSKFVYVTSQIDQTGAFTLARDQKVYGSIIQMSLLNGIPEGYTENQRIGRQINLTRLRMRADLDPTIFVTNVLTSAEIRFLVVYYKPVNGKPVTYETFLKKILSGSGGTTVIPPTVFPYEELNHPDFDVLFDKVVGFNEKHNNLIDIDLTRKKTIYSGSTEFQDHVQYGGLYTIALSSMTSSTNASTVSFSGVLYYNDQ